MGPRGKGATSLVAWMGPFSEDALMSHLYTSLLINLQFVCDICGSITKFKPLILTGWLVHLVTYQSITSLRASCSCQVLCPCNLCCPHIESITSFLFPCNLSVLSPIHTVGRDGGVWFTFSSILSSSNSLSWMSWKVVVRNLQGIYLLN